MAFMGALLIAPVAEELLFRGILQSYARKLFPINRWLLHRWGSLIAVGILFGAMHGTTPHHIPALAVFGMILGYLYERTGSLTLPILVHILFNAKSLVWDTIMQTA
jgi:membrane protease YdiL (CAAX protease family)